MPKATKVCWQLVCNPIMHIMAMYMRSAQQDISASSGSSVKTATNIDGNSCTSAHNIHEYPKQHMVWSLNASLTR